MHADEILVLENGQVIERGTHEQLITKHGWYAEMWAKQEMEAAEEGESLGK